MSSTEIACITWKFAFIFIWKCGTFWVSRVRLHEGRLAPAGTIALETLSKLDAGAAASLLGWKEPLCSGTGPQLCKKMSCVHLPALTS